MLELLIQNGNTVYCPAIEGEMTWTTQRQGSPGKLQFNVIKDDVLKITEGNHLQLKVDNNNVFNGFIFTKKSDKSNIISVTAYDQLRYFKNKDTYIYENKRADEVVSMLAKDFNLRTGTLQNTGYKIPSRIEDNATLFDIVGNALDLTLQNKKEMYVLFDDFGSITLKNISDMIVPIVIDEDTGENFSYTSSIDSNTYNKIKLIYDNEDTAKREVYVSQDSENMSFWGVLQYFDKLQKGENGKAKADALLSLYNKKTRSLSISNAFGDIRVRAGCMVVVGLDLGDVKLQNLMLVEKCKHTFKNGEHFMDLTLRGGDFNA